MHSMYWGSNRNKDILPIPEQNCLKCRWDLSPWPHLSWQWFFTNSSEPSAHCCSLSKLLSISFWLYLLLYFSFFLSLYPLSINTSFPAFRIYFPSSVPIFIPFLVSVHSQLGHSPNHSIHSPLFCTKKELCGPEKKSSSASGESEDFILLQRLHY